MMRTSAVVAPPWRTGRGGNGDPSDRMSEQQEAGAVQKPQQVNWPYTAWLSLRAVRFCREHSRVRDG